MGAVTPVFPAADVLWRFHITSSHCGLFGVCVCVHTHPSDEEWTCSISEEVGQKDLHCTGRSPLLRNYYILQMIVQLIDELYNADLKRCRRNACAVAYQQDGRHRSPVEAEHVHGHEQHGLQGRWRGVPCQVHQPTTSPLPPLTHAAVMQLPY